ncbi:MAG: citramalate synthase [Actinomycetota bacterium]|jgi:2-isopropylmalate synthase|nr:citramalate synthase [Actinomycetota bacterium]
MSNKIYVFDTTLRDGAQGENVSFTVKDKLHIIEKFNDIGIDYIEVGFPASNPKDIEIFEILKNKKFKNSKIVAFGRTKYKSTDAKDDDNINTLIECKADAICIFGKSSAFHAEKVIETSLENNLEMIFESVSYLKKHSPEVIFDGEHFFDGFRENPDYAIKTLKASEKGGADFIVLCDTNGGTLPSDMSKIVEIVKKELKTPIGIHVHNDCGCAVANSIIAVNKGATMVQGTINGYGERTGNADLCQIIPNLEIKMKMKCLQDDKLKDLTSLSRFIAEIANQIPSGHQPFVGSSAFAHKAGMHVSGVSKYSTAFEHVSPELVGNSRRILISELSGKKSIILKAKEFGINLEDEKKTVSDILEKILSLEHHGYQFEAADASFELLVRDITETKKEYFKLESFRILNEKKENGEILSEATVKIHVNAERIIETAEGVGPVNALDKALRKALTKFYPGLEKIILTDFKVRVLDEKKGTGAIVRVLIESTDGEKSWGTIGVSENIIEASWEALSDSIVYGLNHIEK